LHSSAGVSPEKRGAKRILIEITVFLLLSAATAVSLRPLQVDLLRRMTDLRDAFIARAEMALGLRLQYRSMGPSLFRAIDLRDVAVVGEDGVTRFSLERIRVEYSLRELLRGGGSGAFNRVYLDRPVVDFDAERDTDLVRRLRSLIDSAGRPSDGPIVFAPDARIRVRSGVFSVSAGTVRALLENAFFEASIRDGRFAISAKADVEYDDSRLPDGLERIKSAFSIQGDSAPDFSRANFTLTVPRLETPVLTLSRQSAVVAYADGAWDIRKAKDRAPFDLRITYGRGSSSLGAALIMENFVPGSAVAFRGSWLPHASWLTSRLSGRTEVSFVSKDSFSYSFGLSGTTSPDTPLPGVMVAAEGSGNQDGVELRTSSLDSLFGSFAYSGTIGFRPFRPKGVLKVSEVKLPEGDDLNAVLQLSREGESISFFAEELYLGSMRLDSFGALIRIDRGVVSFSGSALRTAASGGAAAGRIACDGSYALKNPYLQATFSLESLPVSDILEGLRPFIGEIALPANARRLSENVSLTAEAFLTTDLKDISFNVPRLFAGYRGSTSAYAVMALFGTKDRLTLRDVRLNWEGGSALGAFSIDFADPADIALSAEVTYRDISYSAEGLLLDKRNLSFRGDYGLAGNIILSEEAGISGSVAFDALPIPVAEYRFSAGASVFFRYAASNLWNATVQRFSLEETGVGTRRPLRVSFRGQADQAGAALDELIVEDDVGRLSGDARVDWEKGFSAASAAIRLADQLGEERYEADGFLGKDGVRVRAYGAGIRGARFLENTSKVQGTGEIRGRWKSRSDYEADVKVADFRTELSAEEYRMSGSGRITPDYLEVENVQVSGKAGLATVPRLSVDRLGAKATLSAAFRGILGGREAETSFAATLSFAPFKDWANAAAALDRGSARIAVGKARYATINLDPFELRLVKEGAEFSVDGGPQNALRLRFDAEGSFFAALSAPSPIRASVLGTIKDGMIDARANNVYLDFASLWSGLNLPNVVFSSGIATGSLAISGPISDPDFYGTASATGFRARVPAWITEEIGPVAATVTFDGKGFGFGPVPVSVKKGGGTLSGRFYFDRWIPFQFELLFDVRSATPVPVKSDVAGIIAKGFASGRLSLSHTYEKLSVSGKIAVENTTIKIDYNSLMAAYTTSFVPMDVEVDLELDTGKKVEFVWPSTDYPVLRGYADTGNALKIAYDGQTGRYSLLGDIKLRGGEVFYVMRSFYIREGAIKFNENELRVDPRLSIRAEIRDRNDEGPVTIALIVDEAPLSSFMPRFESIPPLSQAEIFGMLGQNVLGADASGNAAQTRGAVLSATSDVLAQFNVVRVFERNVRERLGLDMFSIRTQLIQNAFLGASGLIDNPVDRNAGLGNYFDNTTVYMGKFFSSAMFLQGLLSLQVDETRSKELLGGLSLETELGIEWKTPFFLVRWDFAPDFKNDADKLFINDHSFTLIWRKTF
jgi:hypothetical protein